MYPWIRASLSFTGITVEQHEALAEKLGAIAAAEVLLLVISYKCQRSRSKWKKAKDLGIPWLNKRWSNLKGLQHDYNEAVAQIPDLVEEDADFHGIARSRLAVCSVGRLRSRLAACPVGHL